MFIEKEKRELKKEKDIIYRQPQESRSMRFFSFGPGTKGGGSNTQMPHHSAMLDQSVSFSF
jgi:hypothetical protein